MENFTFNGLSSIFELSVGFNLAATVSVEFITLITTKIISYKSPIKLIQEELLEMEYFKSVTENYIKVKSNLSGATEVAENIAECNEIIKQIDDYVDESKGIELVGDIRYKEILEGSKLKFQLYAIFSALYSIFILLTNILDFERQFFFISILNTFFVAIIVFIYLLERDNQTNDIVFDVPYLRKFEVNQFLIVLICISTFALTIIITMLCSPMFELSESKLFYGFVLSCGICLFLAFPHFIYHFLNFSFIMQLSQKLKIPTKNSGMKDVLDFKKKVSVFINKNEKKIKELAESSIKQQQISSITTS